MEERPNVIIDTGSYYTKTCLSQEEEPRSVFPSCIGYAQNDSNYFIGSDAYALRDKYNLKMNYPIEYGAVNNWDDMEKIFRHIFPNELCMEPDLHNVMLTILPQSPKENIEKSGEIMLENLNVNGLYMEYPGFLSLYTEGKFTGLSIDLGHTVTYFIPILNGKYIHNNITSFNIGGKDINEFIKNIIGEKIQKLPTSVQEQIIKDIKHKACYIANDYEKEIKSVEPYDYEMPDGEKITLKQERIICPEGIFKSFLLQKKDFNITQTCFDTIKKYDDKEQKELYNNIILSGGNSMFEGLQERLKKELKDLVPESMKKEVRVIASPKRNYSAVIGGSILSSISSFKDFWVTKAEYEENGADIIFKKCNKFLV